MNKGIGWVQLIVSLVITAVIQTAILAYSFGGQAEQVRTHENRLNGHDDKITMVERRVVEVDASGTSHFRTAQESYKKDISQLESAVRELRYELSARQQALQEQNAVIIKLLQERRAN